MASCLWKVDKSTPCLMADVPIMTSQYSCTRALFYLLMICLIMPPWAGIMNNGYDSFWLDAKLYVVIKDMYTLKYTRKGSKQCIISIKLWCQWGRSLMSTWQDQGPLTMGDRDMTGFTTDFWPAIQIRWKVHIAVIAGHQIATNFCTWHDSTAVVPCTNFIANVMLKSMWAWMCN